MATIMSRPHITLHSIKYLSTSCHSMVFSRTSRFCNLEISNNCRSKFSTRLHKAVIDNINHTSLYNRALNHGVSKSTRVAVNICRNFNSQNLSAKPLAIHKHISSLSSKRIPRKKKEVPLEKVSIIHYVLIKDKYPNFEVGLKCIFMVFPYLLLCSYINENAL